MPLNVIVIAFTLLIVGNLFATFSDVLVKIYATPGSIYQYLLLRQLIMLVVITPFWLRQNKAKRSAGSYKVQGSRAILANIGGAVTVVALLNLPLATANVIFYAAPMLTMLLAAWLLHEPIKKQRIIAMLTGFAGIALAMRPEYINIATLAALGTALCVALFNLSVRWLPKDTSTVSTMFWTNILAMPITATIAWLNWTPVTMDLWILAGGACLCLMVYQGSCIIAFRRADAGAVAIAEYSGLVFAGLLGYMLFNEHLDVFTLSGMALIIAPIAWQSRSEYKAEKRRLSAEYIADTSPPHPNFLAQAGDEKQ